MPAVLRVGPYRFYFFAGDCDEPPHVYVESDENEAKISLVPVRLERSGGFSGQGTAADRADYCGKSSTSDGFLE